MVVPTTISRPHEELSNNMEARQYLYNDSDRCNQAHQSMIVDPPKLGSLPTCASGMTCKDLCGAHSQWQA